VAHGDQRRAGAGCGPLPPPGQDSDARLRRDGAEAFRQRLAGALHWLHWELEQLLATARAASEDLAFLPPACLRQRAEHQLRGPCGSPSATCRAEYPGSLHREALISLQQLQQ
jgi:hypothetical protein